MKPQLKRITGDAAITTTCRCCGQTEIKHLTGRYGGIRIWSVVQGCGCGNKRPPDTCRGLCGLHPERKQNACVSKATGAQQT